jgi:oligosaccharide 4-alpha-D-glucosyltransferase
MKNLLVLTILALQMATIEISAQILSVVPSDATADSTITLVYDASLGNGELAGYNGDVYMHAGLITAESNDLSDWKYVVSGWCENTSQTKMTSLGNNLYQATYHIRSFYGVPDNEIVLQLAFVFRSADCNRIGRDVDNKDIFYKLANNYSTASYAFHELKNDTLLIYCDEGNISITPFNERIINVFSSPAGEENQASYSTVAEKQVVDYSFSQELQLLKFSTNALEVVIDTSDLSFKFVYNNDTILHFLKIYEFDNRGILISKLKEDERIYGSGSRAIDMDRRGRNLSINNKANWGYGSGAENLNITLPVVNSSENYMLFYDNHSIAALDIGSAFEDQMSYTYTNGQAEVFVIAGKNHNELVENYSYLTGYQPIPPLWSLGYIQSKYGYETQTEASNIVNQLINADYPLDALVLDLFWFGNTSTMGNLNWDYSRFPNPTSMMSSFKSQGVKTVLITEPYFTLNSTNYTDANTQGYFAADANGETYVIWGFWAGDAALLDLFHPEVPAWFNQFYTARTNEGVSGWWTDLGEPETHPDDMFHFGGQTASEVHNIYSLEWNKMLYENWETEFPQKRLFNLSRSGFAGMQRYSTFPWSGDVQRSFDGLKVQVPIMLSLGLNGIPFMHSDVGGFTGGGNEDELFIRWVQMGIFAPVFRIHGAGIETAPTAYGVNAQNITRDYIKWRYELLPYNYTLAYEASAYGTPMARPMDFYENNLPSLQNLNDQYHWGENMIIAPVMEQGQTEREVVLPDGTWINYHNHFNHQGPQSITTAAPLTHIPVFVKAGSFIPTVKNLQSTDDYTAEDLYIQYYPDYSSPESYFTLFDDDKSNPKSLEENEFILINFDGLYLNDKIEISLGNNGQSYLGMPDLRQFTFEIFRIMNSPKTVLLDESPLNQYFSLDELSSQVSGYFFNSALERLFVKIPYSNGENIIKLESIQVNRLESSEAFASLIDIYPNPGNNELYISSRENFNGPSQILIANTAGEIVLQKQIWFNSVYKLNTTDLSQGIYLIQVINDKNISTLKWIKN